MTSKEMRENGKDHRDSVDWSKSESTNAAHIVCCAMWSIAAEICERLDNLAGHSVSDSEH